LAEASAVTCSSIGDRCLCLDLLEVNARSFAFNFTNGDIERNSTAISRSN